MSTFPIITFNKYIPDLEKCCVIVNVCYAYLSHCLSLSLVSSPMIHTIYFKTRTRHNKLWWRNELWSFRRHSMTIRWSLCIATFRICGIWIFVVSRRDNVLLLLINMQMQLPVEVLNGTIPVEFTFVWSLVPGINSNSIIFGDKTDFSEAVSI